MRLVDAGRGVEIEPGPDVPGQGGTVPASSRRASVIAIAILIALPTLFFGGFDLFGGHLLLSGDNLIQFFPMRVLAGNEIHQGVLPAWDPYIWSGTPLMADLNAGAFFPTTLLFALLPPDPAWVIGEIVIYSLLGVGTFLLFRSGGASAMACLIGAGTFTFAGAVLSQTSVHIDMGAALACLPWALLGVRQICDEGRWRWSVLLGVALAGEVLDGSPEGLIASLAACAAYALLRLSMRRRSWWQILSRLGAAGAMAVGTTAFLWIPALAFIGSSQRTHEPVAIASEFSFPPWSSLLSLVPYLEGGYHLFSQPQYFGQSNLGEITLYVGILPLVATLALGGRSWGRWLPPGERRCWYGLLIVGAVLAIVPGTRLEPLLHDIPFYGSQRDGGRNIVLVDLAECALFTWWIDGGTRPERARGRLEVAMAFVPFALVVGIGTWYAVSPGSLWSVLRAYVSPPFRPTGIAASIGLACSLAAAAAMIAVVRRRSDRSLWIKIVAAFTVVDLALFWAGSSYLSTQASPDASHPGPVLSMIDAVLSPGGRYAVFDPDLYDPTQLVTAGQADVGILAHLPTVTGYGSIVNGDYADETATTTRAFIDPAELAGGGDSSLGIEVLVAVPEDFLVPVGADGTGPASTIIEPPGSDPVLPAGDEPLAQLRVLQFPLVASRPALVVGGRATWWFGGGLSVRSAVLDLARPTNGQVVRVGLVDRSGTIRWRVREELRPSERKVSFELDGTGADGLAVQLLRGRPLGPVRAGVSTGSRSYLLSGPLSDAVDPEGWHQVGSADGFDVFRSVRVPQAAWLELAGDAPSGPPAGSARRTPAQARATTAGAGRNGARKPLGTASVLSSSVDGATIAVDAGAPARLVWSMAFDAGWRAELIGPDGRAQPLTVQRVGLVQGVDVPAGHTVVRFSYLPPGFDAGLVLSIASVAILVVVASAAAVVRRRRSGTGTDSTQLASLST